MLGQSALSASMQITQNRGGLVDTPDSCGGHAGAMGPEERYEVQQGEMVSFASGEEQTHPPQHAGGVTIWKAAMQRKTLVPWWT